MKHSIMTVLNKRSHKPSHFNQLLTTLGLRQTAEPQLKAPTAKLGKAHGSRAIKQNTSTNAQDKNRVTGRIQITAQGRGFVQPDNPDAEEIVISACQTGTAFNGDRVQVKLSAHSQGSRSNSRPTGAVVAVLERKRTKFVGTLERRDSSYFVVLDDSRISQPFQVAPPKKGRAKLGDKVLVALKKWSSARDIPQGEIMETLGPANGKGVDMVGVLRQYDLSAEFPPEVLKEVKRLGSTVTKKDLTDRTDCRSHPVITIDPADAKDFDDAFSLTRAGKGRWKLCVHIADVSHYVKAGSAIDKEAQLRANSTYLVDRVIPMLPEALSNHLCSLMPHVDRLTKCVEFLITDEGKVLRSSFYAAVIHSKQRYSYEQAMDVIENDPSNPLEQMLHSANTLAAKIRRRRIQAGSLDMDFPETKIHLDAEGKIKKLEAVDYDASHQLIEEFMLLANESVARHLQKLKRPSLHRVHEEPDCERLAEYRTEVRKHGIQCGDLTKTSEVQKLFKRLHEHPIGPVLKIGFLRSLMKARYAAKPEGHYGLAKTFYTHFTSPIRRYADLVVHRSLFGETQEINMEDIALHITDKESNSTDAERDSKNLKLYSFLSAQLETKERQAYTALVTEVRNIGISISVSELGLKGMIPFSQLKDDFYQFDPAKNIARGQRQGRLFKLGDEVQVVIAKVDSDKQRLDFTLSSNKRRSERAPRKRRARKRGAKRAALAPA
ncbi:ribonuclease R [Rubritalea spongiae]|uniref:Ribonuclease R n=1 Tax=Rubritalea spongiae TaxID=430797 RepID=A0ABW5E6S7_9BACT